jgi:hypothetical protein
MCPLRIVLFVGSLLIVCYSVWVLLWNGEASPEGLSKLKRADQSWVRRLEHAFGIERTTPCCVRSGDGSCQCGLAR